MRLTGFVAWWVRRTYYLFQMRRWDRRLRIVLDWTVALFFRPDITRVDLRVERELVKQARRLVERSSDSGNADLECLSIALDSRQRDRGSERPLQLEPEDRCDHSKS